MRISARIYLIREAILFLGISYLVLFGSTHNGLIDKNLLLVTGAVFSILFLYNLFGKPISMGVGGYILILWFLGLTLATIESVDPRRSLSEVWLIGTAVFLFLQTGHLRKAGWEGELFAKVLLIVIGIVMVFAWIEPFQWYITRAQLQYDRFPQNISFRLSLPNFFAMLFNIGLFIALGRLLYTRDRIFQLLLGVYCTSAILLLYLTSSRGGWLAALAGLLAMGVIFAHKNKKQMQKTFHSFRKSRLLQLVAAIIFIGFSLMLVLLIDKVSNHPTHAPLLESRKDFWGPAWQSFLRSPLTGSGPFTFISFYMQQKSIPPYPFFVYSHNMYLDFLSGSGLVGLLTFLLVLIWIMYRLWNRYWETEGLDRALVLGAIGAFGAFCVHGLVDSVHHTIPTIAWVMAILLGAAIFEPVSISTRKLNLSMVFGATTLLVTWFNVWSIMPYSKGVECANEGSWHESVYHFQKSLQRDPKLAVLYQQIGLAYSKLAENSDPQYIHAAINAYEKCVQIDPYFSANHANLAALYLKQGELDAATISFQKAAQLAPASYIFPLNLGIVREAAKDTLGARDYYLQALDLNPNIADAFFWQGSDFRKSIVMQWHEQKQVVQLVDQQGKATGYMRLAAQYISQKEYMKAEELIGIASLAYFDHEREKLELSWLKAEVAAGKGNYKQAVEFGQEAADGYEDQGLFGPGSYGKTMYAPLMFRRPTMQMDWVPQLTLIKNTEKGSIRKQKLELWRESFPESTIDKTRDKC